MARVEAFEIEGLMLIFYSNDHRPPHFHVKKTGAWEVRVFIETTTDDFLDLGHVFQKKHGPSGRLQRQIAEQVSAHRSKLLEEWEAKVHDDD